MKMIKPNGALVLLMVMIIITWSPVLPVSANVQASITNKLGSGKNLSLHCQSKDDDLGQQNISNDASFSWEFSVNPWGTTLFFCVLGWESVGNYEFDAYSFARDRVRCENRCAWLVSAEGIYGLNDQTGFWEYVYSWPVP
ncbi:Self-incompatibility protein [Parasponia andersonii]|uniref:S-protein homolog n=1 Tax=Parasponia andersonii TaxID=3476 RepID=A0A2P5DSD0_PARAD|nr:Self-incompatibility protein [Parasponia andersonii]